MDKEVVPRVDPPSSAYPFRRSWHGETGKGGRVPGWEQLSKDGTTAGGGKEGTPSCRKTASSSRKLTSIRRKNRPAPKKASPRVSPSTKKKGRARQARPGEKRGLPRGPRGKQGKRKGFADRKKPGPAKKKNPGCVAGSSSGMEDRKKSPGRKKKLVTTAAPRGNVNASQGGRDSGEKNRKKEKPNRNWPTREKSSSVR